MCHPLFSPKEGETNVKGAQYLGERKPIQGIQLGRQRPLLNSRRKELTSRTSCSPTLTTGTTVGFYRGQDSTDINATIWNLELGIWEGPSSSDRDREKLRPMATYSNGSCKQILVPSRSLLINFFIISFMYSSMYLISRYFSGVLLFVNHCSRFQGYSGE